MVLKSLLNRIIDEQRTALSEKPTGIEREMLAVLPELGSLSLIVSGIRRCGKSTLIAQWLQKKYPDALFLNFEDTKLYDFEPNDFSRLSEIIAERKIKTLFLDEIQIIDGWERYVRQKLDEGFQVAITGSNASLLSRELGTKLTGRHITKELFPFGFAEFCRFKNLEISADSSQTYLQTGGFPEYLKDDNAEVLTGLFNDILLRDIIVRYNIRDSRLIQRLAAYLIANVGNLVTGNKLKAYFDIKSTSTIMEYLSHLELSYLFFTVPKFSYSIKKQIINPRKLYAIDNGMVTKNSVTFSENSGRLFENMVFLYYRRRFKEICYFAEKGECDFIVSDKNTVIEAIQACYELTPDNLEREINGLVEALNYFDMKEGKIITMNQKDNFTVDNKTITAIPFFELEHKKGTTD
ncbi:MAG: ATP-binding protein [Prevotellaceae bacterium]|jgi:predicted AAA+ superfamily ATPase|nr:ATP-binding protein [Prevotellaceae bacterium]